MPMNDLLKMKFFILLSKTSLTAINAEIQDAYEDFIKYIVATAILKISLLLFGYLILFALNVYS